MPPRPANMDGWGRHPEWVEVTPTADQDLVVRVSDDSVGLLSAFEGAQATTLGLRLVANLAGQFRGRLAAEDRPEPGTAF